jgi:hypothetical protein
MRDYNRKLRRQSAHNRGFATPSHTVRLQVSEIARLLVRVLKILGFADGHIIREIGEAACRERPRPLRAEVSEDLAYCARLLARWAEDPSYINKDGRPRDLKESGGTSSFYELVEDELTGEDPKRCLQVLLATRSVIRLPTGLLRWRSRTALGFSGRSIYAQEFLRPLTALLATLESNLARPPGASRGHTFQRGVCGFEVPERCIPDLHRIVERHGMGFIEVVDNRLNQQSREPSQGSRMVRPYVGVFMIGDVRQRAGAHRRTVRGDRRASRVTDRQAQRDAVTNLEGKTRRQRIRGRDSKISLVRPSLSSTRRSAPRDN